MTSPRVPADWGHPSGPELTVDLAAIAWNTRLLAARARGRLMAVVKANGFGHGAVPVAQTALASGASWLGVTTLDEALGLRGAGIAAPALSWLNPVSADFEAAIAARIDLAVPSVEHLRAVAASAARVGRPADIHLHVDTGMTRDGASEVNWAALCGRARLLEQQGFVRVIAIMSHLGCADDPTDPSNETARSAFETAVVVARNLGLRPTLRHLAATSATLTDERTRFDLCRVGAGLVGIDPSATTALRPAMSLTAPVVSVRSAPAGRTVGYGHTYRTVRSTRLALLPIGYADGIPRATSGRAFVQIRGRRRPVVGLVSMDQIVVDVGADPVEPGEVATVFGNGSAGEPTAVEWAHWAGSIPHEIVTGIGPRVSRRIIPADGAPLKQLAGAAAGAAWSR